MKINKKILIKNIKKNIRPIYYFLIKLVLPKSFLLRKYGLLAIGERNRMIKNPRWVTLDVVGNPDIKLDLEDISKKLPFKSNSLKAIYSSHNLEHISMDSALFFFNEVYRILKKGGELILDVPCAKTTYDLIGLSINEPNNLTLKRHLKSYNISNDLFNLSLNTCPTNKNVPIEWINHPVNQLSQLIACYIDGINDAHLPVITNPEEVIKAYKNYDMNDFFEFLFDKLPEGKRYSGGHCEAWYPEKLSNILEKKGFKTSVRFFGESELFDRTMVPDKDAPARDAYSFKMSAIKLG